MRNIALVPHIPVATAIITLFLSQMAILAVFMSFVRTDRKKTYIRSTINSEEETRVM